MNEEDLRDCFAMFAMLGIISREVSDAKWMSNYADNAYKMADAMLEARKQKEKEDEEDIGIASVAKRKYRRKS